MNDLSPFISVQFLSVSSLKQEVHLSNMYKFSSQLTEKRLVWVTNINRLMLSK
jgi:hypothetical protein